MKSFRGSRAYKQKVMQHRVTWYRYWRKYRTRYRTVHILSSIVYGTGCRPGGSVATVFLSSHT
eukprot:COSAG02_NODE_44809_length_362_cov_6.368821_1_plen_62_part_01